MNKTTMNRYGKIIIESYGTVLAEFTPTEVDHIDVCRYFDVEQANKRDNPYVAYINHFERPIPKTGRILCVNCIYDGHADIHLFDPDSCFVTFK